MAGACGGGGPTPPPTSDAGPCVGEACGDPPDCAAEVTCEGCMREGACGWCNGVCVAGADEGPDSPAECGADWSGHWVWGSPDQCTGDPGGLNGWTSSRAYVIQLGPDADAAAVSAALDALGLPYEWLGPATVRVTFPPGYPDVEGTISGLFDYLTSSQDVAYFAADDPELPEGSFQVAVPRAVLRRLVDAAERYRASGAQDVETLSLPVGIGLGERVAVRPTEVRAESFRSHVEREAGREELPDDRAEIAVFEAADGHFDSAIAVIDAPTPSVEGYLRAAAGAYEVGTVGTPPPDLACARDGSCAVLRVRRVETGEVEGPALPAAHSEWCGTALAAGEPPPAPPPPPTPHPAGETCRRLELAIEVDKAFLDSFGGDLRKAKARLYALVAAARRPYMFEFGVIHALVELHIWEKQDPYSNDSGEALEGLRDWWRDNMADVRHDLCHLISGKANFHDRSGAWIAGRAYLTAICGANRYGVTANGGANGPVYRITTLIHELGHNHGAPHEWEVPGTEADCDHRKASGLQGSRHLAMCYTSGRIPEFSPQNELRIRQHVAAAACLDAAPVSGCHTVHELPQVTDVTASDNLDCSVEVKWKQPAVDPSWRISGYFIYRADAADGTFEWQGTADATSSSFHDATAEPGRHYFYKVQARFFSYGGPLSAADEGFARDRLCPPVFKRAEFTAPTTVALEWELRPQTPPGSTYHLFRCEGHCGDVCAAVNHLAGPLATETRAHTDAAAETGVWYQYGISIANSPTTGVSACSTRWARRQLEAPTAFSATDDAHLDKVEVRWARPTPGVVTGYRIFRRTDRTGRPCDDKDRVHALGDGGATSWSDTTAQPGVVYFYSMQAVSRPTFSYGKCTEFDQGRRKRLDRPTAPTGFSAADGAATDRVRLTWQNPAGATVTGFEVFRSDNRNHRCEAADRIHESATAGTSYDDTSTSLTAGADYTYSLRLRNEAGTSDCVSDVGWRKLPAPTILAGPDGEAAAQITFAGEYSCDGRYIRVLRGTTNNPITATVVWNWDYIDGDTCNRLWFGTDVGADPSRTYYYWAQSAVDGLGRRPSDMSAPDTAGRRLLPPSPVTASQGTYADRVQVTFPHVPGSSYFRVYRSCPPAPGCPSDMADPAPVSGWMAIGGGVSVLSWSDYIVNPSFSPGAQLMYYVRVSTTTGDSGASELSEGAWGWLDWW